MCLDDSLEVIAHEARRTLLMHLREREPIDVRAVENDLIGDDYDRHDVRTRLHHVHLPKLEGAGVVVWDRDPGEIHRGWAFPEVEPLLAVLDEHSERIPGSWP